MKLTSIVATALASTGALAAPTAAPTAAPAKQNPDLIYPSGTYRYWVQSGEIIPDPQNQLLVVKAGDPDHSTTAIVTFDFNPDNKDRTCRLVFDLWDRDVTTGTQDADIFTVINPPESFSTKSKIAANRPAGRPGRDEHKGRIHAPKPGRAEWTMKYGGYPEFPCPSEETMAIEYVGVGDEVTLGWDIGVTGPRIEILE